MKFLAPSHFLFQTHLSRRLRGKAYAKNVSTDGIDVASFRLRGMELTWFDFGGQEVYYPTHQFFLTPQCLYLVVFNLQDPDYKVLCLFVSFSSPEFD